MLFENHNDALAYLKQFKGKLFKDKLQGRDTFQKVCDMLKIFGFQLESVDRSGTCYYFLDEGEGGEFIQVQVKLHHNTRYKNYEGWFNIFRYESDGQGNGRINPHTGQKWKLGDIDYSKPGHPMLTRRGWSTMD